MSIKRWEFILVGSAIGIVIAILYCAFDNRRQAENTTHCTSNLKRIGLAMMQYTQDFDDTLPRSWFGKDAGPSDPKTNYKWMDAIFPYIKSTRYFVCPNDRNSKPYEYRSGVNYGSYLYNNAYYATGDKLTPPDGQKLANIASMTVLVMDGKNDFRFAWADVANAPIVQNDKLGNIAVRHLKHPMTLWVDGSVHSYSLRQIIAEKQVKGQNVYSGFTIESD